MEPKLEHTVAATFASDDAVAHAEAKLIDGGIPPEHIVDGSDARRAALSVEMLAETDEMVPVPAAGPYTGGMVRGALLGASIGGAAGVLLGVVGGLIALPFTDFEAWKVLVLAAIAVGAALSTTGALIGGPVVSLRHDQHRHASGLEDDGGVFLAEMGPNVAVITPDPDEVARARAILAAEPDGHEQAAGPDPGRMQNRDNATPESRLARRARPARPTA